jgi:hypothetical protein
LWGGGDPQLSLSAVPVNVGWYISSYCNIQCSYGMLEWTRDLAFTEVSASNRFDYYAIIISANAGLKIMADHQTPDMVSGQIDFNSDILICGWSYNIS